MLGTQHTGTLAHGAVRAGAGGSAAAAAGAIVAIGAIVTMRVGAVTGAPRLSGAARAGGAGERRGSAVEMRRELLLLWDKGGVASDGSHCCCLSMAGGFLLPSLPRSG